MAIKVFGHLVPDTDSTCSAIVYAWYLKTHKNIDATPFVQGLINKEAAYVLTRFGHEIPALLPALTSADEVIVVDTNNPEELSADFFNAKLLEIIDHHKMGGVTTSSPLKVTIRPLACTATVLWQLMKEDGLHDLPADIAGMMLACILSDTLNFTSPTVTDSDRSTASDLTKLAGIEPNELANAMFEAKSDLSGMSVREILKGDAKKYSMGGKAILMATLETTKPENALAMQTEFIQEMIALKQDEHFDGIFFFIVDILKTSSTLLLPSEYEVGVAEKGFGETSNNNVMDLPGVVSRKKQMAPAIEKGVAL